MRPATTTFQLIRASPSLDLPNPPVVRTRWKAGSTMRMIGRQPEFTVLADMIVAPREGSILVHGRTGLGRSRMLRAVEEAAIGSGIATASVRSNTTTQSWPSSGFMAIIGALDDARAIDLSGRFAVHSADDATITRAANDLLGILRDLRLEPVILLVDDADRMDALSRALLGHVSSRLAGTGIRLIATAGTVTEELSVMPALRLPPLSRDESLDLALELAGPGTDHGTLRILADASGGNALVLRELVSTLGTEERVGRRTLALPPRIDSRVASTVLDEVLPAVGRARQLLERMSVVPIASFASITRTDDDEDDVQDLIDARILAANGSCLRVRDPLLRSALHAAMDSRARRELHRSALAQPIVTSDPVLDAAAAAWHRSFAAPRGDEPSALLEAAIVVVGRDDLVAGVEFADRALSSDVLTPADARIGIRFVDALHLRGEYTLAARYAGLVGRIEAEADVFLALGALRVAIEYGRTSSIPEDVVDSWVGIGEEADPEGAARLAALAAVLHTHHWDEPRARRALDRSIAVLPEAPDDVVSIRRGADDFLVAMAGRPDPSSPPVRGPADSNRLAALSPFDLLQLGHTLSAAEDYGRARRVLAMLVEHPGAVAPAWIERAHLLAAHTEMRAGDFHLTRAAIRAWESARLPAQRLVSDRLLLRVWIAMADADQTAGELMDEAADLAAREGNTVVSARLLGLRGRHAILERDMHEAVRLLVAADSLGRPFASPDVIRHEADLVEALSAEGREADAEHILGVFADRQRARPSRWGHLALARATAITANGEHSLQLFDLAVARFGPGDSAFERGRTQFARAERLETLGRRDEAGSAFEAAAAAFHEAGATRGVAASEKRDAPSAEHDRSAMLKLLTAEEREVAERVRLGLRNKEIASALFVSLRTVELRLTRVYRKTGARSRSHLVTLLN